jgi:DNA polymerase III subunit delta
MASKAAGGAANPLLHLVKGDDPALRDRVVDDLVAQLLAGDDRSLALEDQALAERRGAAAGMAPDDDTDEVVEGSAEQPVFRQIVTALTSPPFMTERRVVVVRNVASLTAEQIDVLVDWLGDPVPTSALVLVSGGGRISTRLTKALTEAGAPTHVPAAEQRGRRGDPGPVERQLAISAADADVKLTRDAIDAIVRHLGEDAGRVPELVQLLRSAHGPGSLDLAAVEPYLGEAGTAERFALANAIDAGDVPRALEVLHRLMRSTSARQAKGLHPLQLMMTLQFHYRSLLRLDDPAIATKEQAAEALGQSPWAAKHRLDASRRLGPDGLREATRLLAEADVDLRGASGVPEETVMEVLVARLASLSPSRRPS